MAWRVPEIPAERLVTAELGEAERVALAYAPAKVRAGLAAVLAFDSVLARVAVSAREPLHAQLKLAWWREACAQLPAGRGPPVLAALAATWRQDPALLVALVDAWEEIAAGAGAYAEAVEAIAHRRGRLLGVWAPRDEDAARQAARLWTLTVLAGRAPDAAEREQMRAAARQIPQLRLPRSLRPLAVLAGLSRRALKRGHGALLGDRLSPLAALRLGIFGR